MINFVFMLCVSGKNSESVGFNQAFTKVYIVGADSETVLYTHNIVDNATGAYNQITEMNEGINDEVIFMSYQIPTKGLGILGLGADEYFG